MVVTPVTGHQLSVNDALRTTQIGTEQEADVTSNRHQQHKPQKICVAPEVPAGDTTVMYAEKQGGNLGYSISCHCYHFYHIIECIGNYFLILYATNIQYMVGSEIYGFILDTCFFKRAQTGKYKVLTIRKKFKEIKDLWNKKADAIHQLSDMRPNPLPVHS